MFDVARAFFLWAVSRRSARYNCDHGGSLLAKKDDTLKCNCQKVKLKWYSYFHTVRAPA